MAPKVLFVLPFVVHAGIVLNEWSTVSLGTLVNPQRTLLVLIIDRTFVAIIGFLTWKPLMTAHRTDRLWERTRREAAADESGVADPPAAP